MFFKYDNMSYFSYILKSTIFYSYYFLVLLVFKCNPPRIVRFALIKHEELMKSDLVNKELLLEFSRTRI